MANYTVDIQLALKAQAAEKKLKDIQNLVNKIDNRAASISNRFSKLLVPDKTFARIASKLKNIEGLQKRSLTVVEQRTNRLKQESGLLAGLKKNEELRNQILRQTQVKTAQRLGDLRAQTREISTQVKLRRMMEEGAGIRASYRADAERNAPKSPIGGRANIPGSPAARRAGRAGAGRAGAGRGFQSAALGVGFPLLFGGGAGSIAGGLLGSAGGFGGQILGSALGQVVDNFVAKAAELGQALNKLTPDIDALVKAAGLAGTETELLIKSIEKLEGAQAAQELAAAQLATVVGQDGVAALEDAGAAAQEFTNEAAKAFTALSVALAPALTAVAKFLATNIEESRLLSRTDPGLLGVGAGDLAGNQEVTQIRDYLNKGIITELTARKRLLEIVRKIEATEQRIADKKAENIVKDSISVQLLESKADLVSLQGDLANKAVYLKKIEIAGLEFEQKLRNNNLSILDKEIAKIELLATLKGLENQRTRDLASSEQLRVRAARDIEAAERKEQQVQQGIAQEKAKQLALSRQFARLGETELVQVQMQLDSFDDITDSQARQIRLSTDDIRLENEKLATLEAQRAVQRRQLELKEKEMLIQKQVRAVEARQSVDNLRRGLTQELAGITTPSANSRLDQRNALLLQQTQRYEALLGEVNDKLEVQRTLGTEAASERIKQLNKEKAVYEQLLPQIFAAEQAQLSFNQALEAAKPFADAFTSGLLDGLVAVVDGTKTAEQAFADFLNSIAKMLLQTAQQMIAQYIALGVARAFAGIPAASSSVNTSFMGGGFNPLNFVAGPFSGYGTRALGGSVSGNQPYLVGERGPELFVPGAQGNIVPNSSMGATSIVVNVDASNTNAQGNNENGKRLGSAIGAAVQAELIKQKRPGGLLAS